MNKMHSSIMHEEYDLLERSLLYRELISERDEILRHKWIESEKAGQDIGFDKALLSWLISHRAAWRAACGQTTRQEAVVPHSNSMTRWQPGQR